MDDSSNAHLDLGLHPDDPLNLLLHSSPRDEDSSSTNSEVVPDSASDWSSLWSFKPFENQQLHQTPLKNLENDLELSPFSNLGSLDFNPSMSIDPNALHQSFSVSPGGLNSGQDLFPFTFQNPSALNHPRRLSVGSSSESSASGISSSPVVECSPAFINDSAAQLAQRVRQSAGITYAAPTGGVLQSHGLTIPFPEPSQPIHHLGHPSRDDNSSSSSSAASTPPPTTPPMAHASAASTPPEHSIAPDATSGKPKTSHTTIERRYRTNLNSRIHALRMSVPALRVLEEKEASVGGPGKKGGKGKLSGRVGVIKSTSPAVDGAPIDIVDDRGFIDGVKVARKVSKANVLGKAVEYIRVLKKRETRLRKEQEGLKELICGLVGGPALVQKWEEEWRSMFGGDEKDELTQSEGIEAGLEDGSDDDGDSDDEGARKRKKPKMEPVPDKALSPAGSVMQPGAAGAPGAAVPEKRKRGRPRKNPLPPAAVPPASTASLTQQQAQPSQPATFNANMLMNMAMEVDPNVMSSFVQQPPQPPSQAPQYMMATFALFSFFNSPITSSAFTSSSAGSTHHGHVLTPITKASSGFDLSALTWRDLLQIFHLLVSVLVLASIVLPWLPRRVTRLSRKLPSRVRRLLSFLSLREHRGQAAPSTDDDAASVVSDTSSSSSESQEHVLTASLMDSLRGAEDEATRLRLALGTTDDSLLNQVSRMSSIFTGRYQQDPRSVGAYEHRSLTQRAWVRLGELCVLQDEREVSISTRLYTYYQIRTHLTWFGASAGDLVTMALLLWPVSFARKQSRSLWDVARARSQREHERLVFESLDPQQACAQLQTAFVEQEQIGSNKYTPIGVLGSLILEKRVKKHLKILFVDATRSVEEESGEDGAGLSWDLGVDIERERQEAKRTVDAALSLGGRYLRALGDCLHLILTGQDNATTDELVSSTSTRQSQDGDGEEIKVLLIALLLYRRIFPSSLRNTTEGDDVPSIMVSPPQGGSKEAEMRLRIVLGNEMFDGMASGTEDVEEKALDVALDEARERVVSVLEDRQRR